MTTQIILFACLGGIIPDVLRLLKLGENSEYKAPDYLTKGFYYFILALQVGLGVLVVYLFKVTEDLQAVVYGYAAPQIFTSAASVIVKKATAGQNGSKPPDRDLNESRQPNKSNNEISKKFTYLY